MGVEFWSGHGRKHLEPESAALRESRELEYKEETQTGLKIYRDDGGREKNGLAAIKGRRGSLFREGRKDGKHGRSLGRTNMHRWP